MESLDKILKYAQNLLQTSSERGEAFRSFSSIHNGLDRSTFIQVCPSFINAAFSFLELQESSSSSVSDRRDAYKLVIQSFVRIYHLNARELVRDLSKPISKFIQQFGSNVPLHEMILYSKFLEATSIVFPMTVSSKKPQAEEKYFQTVSNLSEKQFHLIKRQLETLSLGYVRVLLTGNYRNESRFRDSLSKLMSFFEDFLEIFNVFKMPIPCLNFRFESDFKTGDFFVPFKDASKDSLTNLKRLYFISCSIKNILQEAQSIKMEVPVSAMLTIFQAYTNLFKYKSKEDKSLDFIVPELFQNIYGIIETLLLVAKKSMIPFTKEIVSIIRSSLSWFERFDPKTNLDIRSSFYSFLSVYFSITGFNHNLEDEDLKEVILLVLKNVGIFDMSLKIQLKNVKNSNKNDVSEVLSKDFIVDQEAFVRCTDLSIKVLKTILMEEIILVSEEKFYEVYNEIMRVIIRSLFEIYRHWIILPIPYQSSDCRSSLLECFWLTIINCPSSINPPLESGIAVFEMAFRLEKCPTILCNLRNYKSSFRQIMDSKLFLQGVALPMQTLSPDILNSNNEKSTDNVQQSSISDDDDDDDDSIDVQSKKGTVIERIVEDDDNVEFMDTFDANTDEENLVEKEKQIEKEAIKNDKKNEKLSEKIEEIKKWNLRRNPERSASASSKKVFDQNVSEKIDKRAKLSDNTLDDLFKKEIQKWNKNDNEDLQMIQTDNLKRKSLKSIAKSVENDNKTNKNKNNRRPFEATKTFGNNTEIITLDLSDDED